MIKVTKENASLLSQAWERGLIEPILFDSNQEGMSQALTDAWHLSRKHVLNCSRQLGKTYFIVVKCISFAIQNPGAQIKYAAKTQKQVRKILRTHFRAIFKTCPEDLRPRWHSQDGEYRFPNGSTITIAGCDRENAETLLGQHCHLGVVDEAGSIKDLRYVVDSILMPQTTTTKGRIIIISTPAKTPGHSFKEYCDEAEENKTLVERTIYANPRLSPEDLAELKKEAGGEESTTWKREYLVQHVTDENSAVMPEATKITLRTFIIDVDPENPLNYRPRFYDTYVWLDPGWNPDYTGVLWAIWDFVGARVIIEDEYLMRRMNTRTLARAMREKTDALWGFGHKPYFCVADVDHRLISDLADHKWEFAPTAKDNLDEAINKLRLSVSGQQIPFWTHPRCNLVRRQFENATWNNARTKFARTVVDGHYDLLSAAVYGRRNLHTAHNPWPANINPFLPHEGLVVRRNPENTGLAGKFKKAFGLK